MKYRNLFYLAIFLFVVVTACGKDEGNSEMIPLGGEFYEGAPQGIEESFMAVVGVDADKSVYLTRHWEENAPQSYRAEGGCVDDLKLISGTLIGVTGILTAGQDGTAGIWVTSWYNAQFSTDPMMDGGTR